MKCMLTRTKTFDAAHKLINYDGPCANLHGHTYKLEVTVGGDINETTGMVMDFKDLDDIMRRAAGKYDHAYLNDFFDQPTAENMVWTIAEHVKDRLPEGVELTCVKLWETPDSCATILGSCFK